MKAVFFSLSLFFLTSRARPQCFELKEVTVQWTAFKTPAKQGVSGTFPSLTLRGPKRGASIRDLLLGAALSINARELKTGLSSRDRTIGTFFFGQLSTPTIEAIPKSFEKNTLLAQVVMNGATRSLSLATTLTLKGPQTLLEGKGTLNILDFQAGKALESINKACKALHRGKTWPAVDILLKATFLACPPSPPKRGAH